MKFIGIIKRKVKTAMRMSIADWGLFLQAYMLLGIARFAVLVLPFRWIASTLGEKQQETSSGGLSTIEKTVVKRVQSNVKKAVKYTPWNSNCLAQAIVASQLLKQRNVSSTMYFGLPKPNQQIDLDEAHAWVRSGKFYVVGGDGTQNYLVVAYFSMQK